MKKALTLSTIILTLFIPVVSARTLNTEDTVGILFFAAYCIFIIAMLIFQIVVCLWVYRDAKKRMPENATLWLIAVLVGNIFGFIVYLIVRRDQPVIINPSSTETIA